MEATGKAINSWNHNKEFNWQLMAISHETANKLLQGAFKTFIELEDFERDLLDIEFQNIEILYRQIKNINNMPIFIIETIFVNEKNM